MKFMYLVAIDTESRAQADQVMSERLGPDEDYGFGYTVTYSHLGQTEG